MAILTDTVISTQSGHVYGGTGKAVPDVSKLGPLRDLVGRWASDKDSKDGYNVMPLPQVNVGIAPIDNVILKNFHYFEEMDFGFVGRVPNRGGTFAQHCYALLYEQRVTISDGPNKDIGVHAENGTWLHLVTEPQFVGPYGDLDPSKTGTAVLGVPPAPPKALIPEQDSSRQIAKQVSVPHGNSLLAIGRVTEIEGKPNIPQASALPIGASPGVLEAYYAAGLDEDLDPNVVLRRRLDATPAVNHTIMISVSTKNGGQIGNVPFMESHANVSLFETIFWLEYLPGGGIQLQYSQTINIQFPSASGGVTFPHITANTLKKSP
jgi:hypothetical protein